MEYFKAGYGLVTESDPWTENCNLFYAEYLLLKGSVDIADFDFFTINMLAKWNPDRKLWNRRSGNDTRSMSHDEITGFMVASHLLKTSHKTFIWNHFLKSFGSWNNTGRVIDYLPFNPGNYYAWGAYVESKLRWLFLPLYFINMILAISKSPNETSSKIIYWLELFTMPENKINNWMKRIFVNEMTKQYGKNWLRKMYLIYFGKESLNFPLWKEFPRYETELQRNS